MPRPTGDDLEQVCAVWDIPGFRKPITYSMRRYTVPNMDRTIKRSYPQARLMLLARKKRQ